MMSERTVRRCRNALGRYAAAAGLVFFLGLPGPALGDPASERRGLRFVRLHCARCHAIDMVGESPLAIAPPLRTLHLKYPVSDLQRPLAQGVHPIMPRFSLEPSEVQDIMAYLKTLEVDRP
jgi:cytochrome c